MPNSMIRISLIQSLAIVSLLLISFGFCACSPDASDDDQDRIEQLLDSRRKAMEARDIDSYMALVAENYQGAIGDKPAVGRMISELLHAYESLSVRISDRRIQIDGEHAKASQHYFLIAKNQGEVQSLKGNESLNLTKQAGDWKISGGLGE